MEKTHRALRAAGWRTLLTGLVFCALFCTPFHCATARQAVVRVGFFPFAGFQDTDASGKRSGYGYDYLREIAKHTGWTYEYVVAPFEDCLKMLEAGDIDLVGSLQKTQAREMTYDFASYASGVSSACLFTREDEHRYAYQDYAAFDGMTVGMLEGNSRNDRLAQFCQDNHFSIDERMFSTEAALTQALRDKVIDAALLSDVRRMDGVRVIARFSPSPYYFATTKGNAQVLGELDQAMEAIKSSNPYFDETLYRRHYDRSSGQVPVFTRAEQAFIHQNPVLRVAYPPAHAPMSELDKDGSAAGIAIDLMELLAQKTGLQFAYEPIPAQVYAQDALSLEGVRLIAGLMNSDVTTFSEAIALSDPLLSSALVYVVDGSRPFSPASASTVAVARDNVNRTSVMTTLHPNLTAIEYPDSRSCFYAVSRGEADFTLENIYVAQTLLQAERFANLTALSAFSYGETLVIGALLQDDPLLMTTLNKAIASLSDDEVQAILVRTTIAKTDQSLYGLLERYPIESIFGVAATLALVIGLLLFVLRAKERRNQALESLSKQLRFDELTGIYNRQTFFAMTSAMLKRASEAQYALVRLDVDRFKVFNDVYGSAAGDELLRRIGAGIRAHVGSSGTYGRLQDDHFAICLPVNAMGAEGLSQSACDQLRAFTPGFELTARVGVYIIVDPGISVMQMCDRALLALRSIKGNYLSHCAVYDDGLREQLLTEQRIVSEMDAALEGGQFEIFLQPQYHLSSDRVMGAEALVRWRHPERGLIPPNEFISIFERNGFITRLDAYVWEQVLKMLSAWRAAGRRIVPIAVNLSRTDLYNPQLYELLCSLIDRYQVSAELIKLEITESVYMENPAQVIETVRRLQSRGFQVAMDDFGSGYSSLNMLKEVPVDILKLDLRFLSGDDETQRGGSILNSVIRMARWLQLPVIAEGIETDKQLNFLRSIGCEGGQGYYYARPMPVREFERLLDEPATVQKDTKDRIHLFVNVRSFWSPNSPYMALFSGLVGPCAVIEYGAGNVELLRVSDAFYDVVKIERGQYASAWPCLLTLMHPDDHALFTTMLDRAAATHDIQVSRTRWLIGPADAPEVSLRASTRILAETPDYNVFFLLIENNPDPPPLPGR